MHSYRNQSIDLQCKLIGTTQFICSANQLTDFYNSITLAWYRSIRALWKYIFQGTNAKFQKQSPGGVLEKKCFENFAKFTGKHLCQSFFINKVAGYSLQLYLKICKVVCFRRWFWLKRCSSKLPAVCTFVFMQILLED